MAESTRALRPIFVVEDDLVERQAIARALNEAHPGQPVRIFESAEDCMAGLDKLESDPEKAPKLFILDLSLPGSSGQALISHIRSRAKVATTPIVVVTGQQSPRVIEECYRAGANSYLFKPTDWSGLQELARRLSLYWGVLNQHL